MNPESGRFNVENSPEAEAKIRPCFTGGAQGRNTCGRGQRDFQTIQATASQRVGTSDQIVTQIRANQADHFFGTDLSKKGSFVHVSGLWVAEKRSETNSSAGVPCE